MGRKKGWFSSLKRALAHDSKEKKAEKAKKKLFGKDETLSVTDTPDPVPIEISHPPPYFPPLEEEKLLEVESEQTDHANTVAIAAAAVPASATVAAPVVSQVAAFTQFTGKSREEVAAIRIQTAFRGHMARRALRALRGLVRLKSLVDGPTVKRQTSNTLKYMQSLSRVQSQIQSRRLRMLEENRTLQRQQLQKRAQELESLKIGEEWDDSLQSKERIEENLLHKFEATMRRERALAYSFTHQQTWKKSTKPTSLLFMDPTNPQWGWSWLERQTAPHLMETTKNMAVGEIIQSFARYQLNPENSTPKMASSALSTKKMNSASPKLAQEDDSRSSFSVRNRRHTIGGSSVRDDESLASNSPLFPSYMAPTHSAKAKLKLASPMGGENQSSDTGLAKKRLSFSQSSGGSRRLSGH